MEQGLIELREQVMDRADAALAAAGPARLGDECIHETRRAAAELELIEAKMQANGFDRVEQSRTYRHLGGLYEDLEPALGKEMLLKAKNAYEAAEALLEGQSDDLERAKLNFKFGNTLRRIDTDNVEQLQEAMRRLLAARAYFAMNAPKYLTQADAALQSVKVLLSLAPLANAVNQNRDDMAALEKELAAGGNVNEIAAKAQAVMKRGGGVAATVGRLQTVVDTLPEDQRRNEKFPEIQKQVRDLAGRVLGGNEMTPDVKQVLSLLTDRLKSEAGTTVSKDRAETLKSRLEELGRVLSADEKDLPALREKGQRIQGLMEGMFDTLHYLSHGIERPPAGSRAARLVELNWQLRRYLLEETNRPEKGEEEGKEVLDLSVRASKADRRIYEAGANDSRAMIVEKEELRPLALAIRDFSARMHTMPSKPIWRSANVPVDTNAVFYSGAAKGKPSIAAACLRSGLEIMDEPRGESYASARWKQLQKAATAVFDLRVTDGPDMSAATYELGIALTLGRPVVVLIAKNEATPFDVDIDPVVLTGGPEDDVVLEAAIDQSVVLTYPKPLSDASPETLEYVISRYPQPQSNTYVDQTLRMLSELRTAPDPLAITRTLVKFFDYLNDGQTMLVHPWWSPVYPEGNKPRLFHVMPFRPQWADEVTAVTRAVCEAAGVDYVRADEAPEPNVIRSIWEEIARATHVVVDLTGFSANVALELGITHTLGKNVLIMSQGDPKAHVFESISRFRVQSYDSSNIKKLEQTLGKDVRKFLLSN